MRVVVVDDERPILQWVAALVNRTYEYYELVGAASNGEDALKLIHSEKPDLVFSDIRMPGMDGLELLKRAQEAEPGIYFVMLSNYDDFSYVHSSLTGGAFEYVLKSELTRSVLISLYEKLKDRVLNERIQQIRSISNNEFVTRMLEDEVYTPEQTRALVKRFGLNIQDTYLACAVTKLSDSISGEVFLSQNSDLILSDDISNVDLFVVYHPKRMLFLFNVNGNNEFDRKTLYTRYIKQLFERMNCDIGCSAVHRGYSGLQKAVYEGVKAYRTRMVSEDDTARICRFESISDENHQGSGYDAGKLCREILKKVSSNVSDGVEEDEKRLLEVLPGFWSSDIDQAVTVLSWFMYGLVEASDQEHEENLRKNLKAFNHYLQDKNFREMEKILRDTMDRVILRKQYSVPTQATMTYIKKHYNTITSIREIADYYGYNADYLYRQFKKETGDSFLAYLTKVRMFSAAEILRTTDLSVRQVADRVGYATTDYFTKKFKDAFGCTPNAFRISSRKEN